MAKANSITVRRYAWRSVITPWVIGRLGTLARRRPVYHCEGLPIPHSLFLRPASNY